MGKIRSPLCDVDESLLAFGPTVKTARRGYISVLKQAMMEDGLGDEVDHLPWWKRDRALDALDQAMEKKAIHRLADFRASKEGS